jgi:hypothetical protein
MPYIEYVNTVGKIHEVECVINRSYNTKRSHSSLMKSINDYIEQNA